MARLAPSAIVTVWFYDPKKERVTGMNVINQIVAGFDPPFCHTEMQFPGGEACSIVMQGTVSMRVRSFDPEFYTAIRLRTHEAAVASALALARRHVELGTQFGFFQPRTYCSKLVADILCDSGIVSRNDVPAGRFIGPSTLFHRLERLPCVVLHTSAATIISFVDTYEPTAPRRSTVQLVMR